jgi:hypothetical protein
VLCHIQMFDCHLSIYLYSTARYRHTPYTYIHPQPQDPEGPREARAPAAPADFQGPQNLSIGLRTPWDQFALVKITAAVGR